MPQIQFAGSVLAPANAGRNCAAVVGDAVPDFMPIDADQSYSVSVTSAPAGSAVTTGAVSAGSATFDVAGAYVFSCTPIAQANARSVTVLAFSAAALAGLKAADVSGNNARTDTAARAILSNLAPNIAASGFAGAVPNVDLRKHGG